MSLTSLVIIAVLVFILFESGGIYFFLTARRAKLQGKKLFSEARLANIALSVVMIIVGFLFLVFFIKNNYVPT